MVLQYVRFEGRASLHHKKNHDIVMIFFLETFTEIDMFNDLKEEKGALSVCITIVFKKNVEFSMLSCGFYYAKDEQ